MSTAIKSHQQITRCTKGDKEKLAKKAVSLGWKDSSALMSAVIGLVNAGKLEIKPPEFQHPQVIFKD